MKISASKKTTTITLLTAILLMTSTMLTIIPSVGARSASDPLPNIDWNAFQDHYDPAIYGVYPQFDPTSPNIPVAALIYPGLPDGAVPKYTHDTTAYLSVRPTTVGVGQTVLVNIWIQPGLYHAFFCPDYKVTIEDPTGHQDVRIVDSYYADATFWFEFQPNMVGTWRLKFDFPGLYIPAAMYEDSPLGTGFFGLANNTFNVYTSNYYLPSETRWSELEVQEDIVYSWPAAALPHDYWDRPVNPMNREWWPIGGNFPFTGKVYYSDGSELYAPQYNYHAYVKGPESAHVVWSRVNEVSGLLGGEQYYYTRIGGGSSPNIIYMGRCYGTTNKVVDGEVVNVWECFDLRTGEVYWDRTDVTGAPTQILYELGASEAVPGAAASVRAGVYLVSISGGTLRKYDPWTGALSLETDLPDGFGTTEMYYNDMVLSVQNLGGGNYRLINWTMEGSTNDFAERVVSNITWPISGLGTVRDYEEGLVVDTFMGWNTPPGPQWGIGMHFFVYDMYTGQELWHYATNDTATETTQTGGSCWICKAGMLVSGMQGGRWVGYDLRAKTLAWVSDRTDYPWGSWWPYNRASYDIDSDGDGEGDTPAVITGTYAGVYAINIMNGDLIWFYKNPRSVQYENPYVTEDGQPSSPFFTGVLIADGKVYAYNNEHTASQPYGRDWSIHCINADTGEGIWTMYNPMQPQAVADGYLVAANSYDGRLYVFGQGKSETTVTTGPKTIAKGEPVLIEGTVMDLSSAQPGTPCVSKDSMNIQMEYLHLQQPIDGIWHNETITGVPVTLTAIDKNNNVYDIGVVTTNGYYGTFSHAWTPPEEGTYDIIASFGPDDSYGSSAASASVNVGPAPASEAEIQPEETHPLISTEVALILGIVVIAVIAIAGYWVIRRRQK